jgi:uncharacterized protein YegP (UPF0339 family)
MPIIANDGSMLGRCRYPVSAISLVLDCPVATMNMHFEIYRDEHLQFRWKLTADSGKVVAHSAEGFRTIDDCNHAIALIKKCAESEVRDSSFRPSATPTAHLPHATIPRQTPGDDSTPTG